ncbi:ribosome biogenesis GTP-binding protein YihA/YsxC [Hugenholtzia roseola]|uniref:ribosome biogenesis GTP-binding protein YihA/YsxC n=1 Tax=Hugenholtzia roseola TaxID=1002 RepID=UPI0003FB3A0D|nr:ribosome biogenesis GTP-binding protein YihA/YsxC [Hugenholtzia roseola]
MQITKSLFIGSSPAEKDCPTAWLPEYAFIGRSNVGKSSLINLLTANRHLAKTSSTPGKTQLINHFLINDLWHLVDLPGYGWAKVSKTQREGFGEMIETYIRERKQLVTTFVLVDSRLAPQEIDLAFLEFLGEAQLPFALVFTKIDKLNFSQLQKNLNHYKEILMETWEELPPIFQTSSDKKQGREEILSYIQKSNQIFVKEKRESYKKIPFKIKGK